MVPHIARLTPEPIFCAVVALKVGAVVNLFQCSHAWHSAWLGTFICRKERRDWGRRNREGGKERGRDAGKEKNKWREGQN
jgi:hypothetical protein